MGIKKFSKINAKLNVEKTSNFSIYNPVVECLVVGGGGGGGSWYAGGGGAGGLVYSQNLNFETTQVYTITVGLGGAGRPGTTATASATDSYGSKGENSSVVGQGINIIAYGGGGAPGYNAGYRSDIMDGGSGAGTRPNNYAGTTPGAGVNGQGNSGAIGDPSGTDKGGGGGGAGSAGTSGASGGHGGLGLQYSITGSAKYYAGGGGGGSGLAQNVQTNGGSGVGGNGRSYGDGAEGVINTGSGGGGSTALSPSEVGKGGNGGSGIVILSTEKTAVSYTGSPVISKNGILNVYSFLNSGTITF